MDDAATAGPADVVFSALRQYGVDIAVNGEKLAFAKCGVWCPNLGDDLHDSDDPAFLADSRAGVPLRVVEDGGFVVSGVPIGGRAFMRSALETKPSDGYADSDGC